MSLLTLAQVDGVTVFAASNQVVAIRQDAANPTTRCYVTMQGIETPVSVAVCWAALVVTVDAELSNQYIALLTTGEQVSLSLVYIYQLRPDPSAPLSRTLVVMGAQGTPFMVGALASVLAAAINAYNTFGIPTKSLVFVPTGTIVTNLDSLTMTQAYGLQVGNVCAVWGGAAINATVAGVTEFRASIPWASTFAVSNDLTGQSSVVSEFPGLVRADVPTGSAQVRTTVVSTAALSLRYSYGYVKLP